MATKRIGIVIGAVLAGLLLTTHLAWPCSCVGPTGADILSNNAAVLVGKVTTVEYLEPDTGSSEPPILVTFEVEQVWKGPVRSTANLSTVYNRFSFVTWIEAESTRFTMVMGHPSRYESRPKVVRQFCASCGTQLTYQHSDELDSMDVTACSLDVLDPVSPEDHVWCDRMAPWIELADGLPRFNLGKYD